MRKVKYLIIGGGVTGLSFASYLKSEDYLILEKESEVGGYCRTIYKKDFIWDYAGHFFHFADKEIKEMFLKDIPKEELVFKEKNTKIFFHETLIDYPFQKNIHQLKKEDFIECLYYLFNKEEKERYENFEEMLYGKFGKGITEAFLKPYNEKLYACELNLLDVNSMGRFFPYADIKEIISNMKNYKNDSYNNTFLYPKKGAKVFIDSLLTKLNKKNIKLNTTVKEIDKKRKVVKTEVEEYEYEYLINTSPFNKFIEMVDKRDDVYTSNKVLVFNLGFNKKSLYKDTHWIYYPEKEINFYRVGFYDNILDFKKASLYIEIGFKEGAIINVEEELEKTLINLKKVGIIDDHELEEYSTLVMNPAYVHVSKESNENFKKIEKELNNSQIYTAGRYGAWKYCSIEDNVIEARDLAYKLERD